MNINFGRTKKPMSAAQKAALAKAIAASAAKRRKNRPDTPSAPRKAASPEPNKPKRVPKFDPTKEPKLSATERASRKLEHARFIESGGSDKPDPATMPVSHILRERKELIAKRNAGGLSKEETARLVAIQAESAQRHQNRKAGKGTGPTKIALGDKKPAEKPSGSKGPEKVQRTARDVLRDIADLQAERDFELGKGTLHNPKADRLTDDQKQRIRSRFEKSISKLKEELKNIRAEKSVSSEPQPKPQPKPTLMNPGDPAYGPSPNYSTPKYTNEKKTPEADDLSALEIKEFKEYRVFSGIINGNLRDGKGFYHKINATEPTPMSELTDVLDSAIARHGADKPMVLRRVIKNVYLDKVFGTPSNDPANFKGIKTFQDKGYLSAVGEHVSQDELAKMFGGAFYNKENSVQLEMHIPEGFPVLHLEGNKLGDKYPDEYLLPRGIEWDIDETTTDSKGVQVLKLVPKLVSRRASRSSKKS